MANYYTDNKSLKHQLTHPKMVEIVNLRERNYADANKYDYAPADFDDAIDSYEKVMEIIGEICGDIIAPNAEAVDHEGPSIVNNEIIYAKGTYENLEALKKAGVFGIALPRRFGGLNFSYTPYVMACELVSRADAGFGNIWGLQDCAETLNEFASEEIKAEYLPRVVNGETCSMDLTEPDAGSDLQAVQLKATWDEASKCWRLNGVKRFITNGDADIKLVLARSEEGTNDGRGLSYFVYDRVNKAVTIRRIENKMGIKGSPTAELVFNNAPAQLVGDRKLGLIKYVMALMNGARIGVGAQSVGIAEEAYQQAYKYAHEREQFGKPIIQFPAVYEMLKGMRVKTDAVRSLLYETCRFIDIYKSYEDIMRERNLTTEERNIYKYNSRTADMLTPLLKLFGSEYCNQVAYDSIQIHGGSGFMKDYACERLYRDARITSIYEGTSQLQVVASIRYVTSGAYAKLMEEYQAVAVRPELNHLKQKLAKMAELYNSTVAKVVETKDNEYIDFHARRLVEMAGNIIIGHILISDANRNTDFEDIANLFITTRDAENQGKAAYVNTFNIDDLDKFRN